MCQDLCEIFYVHLFKSQATPKSSYEPSQLYRHGAPLQSVTSLCEGQSQHGNPDSNKPTSVVVTTFTFFFVFRQKFHNKTISKNFCALACDVIPRDFSFRIPRQLWEATFQAS